MYTTLSVALTPLIWLYVHYRRLKGLDDQLRYQERFGYPTLSRPMGRVVWFHSASVGETLSLKSFLNQWHKQYPNDYLLITTTTITAANIVKDQFQEVAVHQFIPFDVPTWVNRFLKHWKPDQAFLVESELWPNLIRSCKTCNIPLILLNARLSDRSDGNWKKISVFAASLLNQFKACLAQGTETAERLIALGAKNVKVMPNLKFSAPPLPLNQDDIESFKSAFKGNLIWIAASTHPGEEEIIFEVHRALKSKLPNLITIIAPRHPHRADLLVKKATTQELSFQTLTLARVNPHTSIDGIIIDKIGQLGTFYELSDIVFMGGSLIPHGGQNPIEATHFKKPVLFGPHMHNFREVCHILEQAGAQTINDTEHLISILFELFRSPQKRTQIGAALYGTLMQQQKSQRQLVEELWCKKES